jgi:hypothetical protein
VADEASVWASSCGEEPNAGRDFDDAHSERGKLGGGESVRFADSPRAVRISQYVAVYRIRRIRLGN